MKKLFTLVACLFLHQTYAQNNLGKSDDLARISIGAYIPEQAKTIPAEAKSLLNNKLNQITANRGLGGNSSTTRFIITANVNVISKDITPTAPPQHSLNLEVTYYIGDGVDGTLFATYSKSYLGIERSETKAYIDALSQIRPSDKGFNDFIEEGKTKIVEYYNTKCDFIIKDAQTAAGQKDFDGAIYKLMSVPDVCKDCYAKCMNAVPIIFRQKLEHECQVMIARAKTLIAQNQYDQAAETLSPILPDVSCYPTADQMMREINDHRCAVALGEATAAWAAKNVNATSNALSSISADSKCSADANRIAAEVRAYVRQVENREWQFKLIEQKDKVDIAKRTIKAVRDIGVAYGSNRPKVVYNTTFISRW
jgi:hypothetical protein